MPYQRKDWELFNTGGTGKAEDGDIRNTVPLDSSVILFADYEGARTITIEIENGLDKDVGIQLIGGDDEAFIHEQLIGTEFFLLAGTDDYLTIVLGDDSFNSYRLIATALVTPTAGTLYAKALIGTELSAA